MRLRWTDGRNRGGAKPGKIVDTLKKATREYLEESDKWEAKWGSFLLMSEELRPDNMPPRPDCPYELNLWYQCDNYNALLFQGGVLDQPYITWTLVQACGAVVSEYNYIVNKRNELNSKLRK